MKRCGRCKRDLADSDFWKSSGDPGGLTWACKACQKETRKLRFDKPTRAYWAIRDAERYARDRERILARQRAHRHAHRKEQRERRARGQGLSTPQQNKARQALIYAVRVGKVVKPSKCERCATQHPKRLLHGHHEDYGKPLEVQWLCHRCHADVHTEKRGLRPVLTRRAVLPAQPEERP